VSAAIGYGLPATIGSAALYGVAPLVQAKAARREQAGRGLGLGLLARLVRRPLWLVGLAVETAAFLLEVYALSVAPVALVGPVMALDMIVFTLLAGHALREQLSHAGAAAICLMVAGVALLAYAFARHGGVGSMASTKVLLLFLSTGLVFALLAALGANHAALGGRVTTAAFLFGVAAGVAYAIATLATRQFGLVLDERRSSGDPIASYVFDLLSGPAFYLLIVFSVLAIGLEQRGLQGQAAVIAFPVTSGISAFLPVVLGLTLFDEPVPTGPHLVAFVAALLLIAAGIAGLARDRVAAVAESDGQSAGMPRPGRTRRADGTPATKA
jgi:multidrug transporter EmrE-like cation transporter